MKIAMCDRQYHLPVDAWHTDLPIPHNEPLNVVNPQSLCQCPPYSLLDSVSPFSVQVPNSMPNATLFPNECPRVSSPSMMPDTWHYTQAVHGTPCTQVTSKPVDAVAAAASPQSLLPLSSLPSAEADKRRNCDGTNTDCDSSSAANVGQTPSTGAKEMSSLSNCVDSLASSVAGAAVPGGVGKTPPTGSGTTVTAVLTSSSAVSTMPRPMCGRAKTNAELKRQLMERREQRLRDMLDGVAERNMPSCSGTDVTSVSECRQTNAATAVVSAIIRCRYFTEFFTYPSVTVTLLVWHQER